LLVLDEKAFYTWRQLFAIFCSVIMCCIGIKLVTMKSKIIRVEATRERADSMTSISKASMVSAKSHRAAIND